MTLLRLWVNKALCDNNSHSGSKVRKKFLQIDCIHNAGHVVVAAFTSKIISLP